MPNDNIEDFLKRAAQRRQSKTVPAPQPPSGRRPEYTDARTERGPRHRSEEESAPLQAILVDEVPSQSVAEQLRAAEQQRLQALRAAAARRAGGVVKPAAAQSASVSTPRAASVAPQILTSNDAGFTAADRLVTMLQHPEGMLQAILLNEVLKRPEHRW